MPPSVGQTPLPFALPRLTTTLRPDIAWPTICICLVFSTVAVVSIVSSVTNDDIVVLSTAERVDVNTTTKSTGHQSTFSLQMRDGFWRQPAFWLAFFLRALTCYVLFTPVHDATHGSVSRKYPFLNDVVGNIASTLIAAPFYLFKRIHLEHHRYVNAEVDSDLRGDPDLFVGGGWKNAGLRLLPPGLRHLALAARCISLPVHYLIHVAKCDVFIPPKLRMTGMTLARDLFLYILLVLGPFFLGLVIVASALLSFAFAAEPGKSFTFADAPGSSLSALAFLWGFPNFCAFGFLGLFFDYLPHRPHDSVNETRATSLVTLFDPGNDGTKKRLTRADIFDKGKSHLLTHLLLSQNYHVLHHCMPSVPFYLYSNALYETDLFDNLAEAGLRAYPLVPVFCF